MEKKYGNKKYENYEDMLKAAREEYLAKVPEGMKEVASGQIDMVLDGIREMAEKESCICRETAPSMEVI